MAPSISLPSSCVLTAGLAWSLDIGEWLACSGLACLRAVAWPVCRRCGAWIGGESSVHGKDVEDIDLVAEAEPLALIEVHPEFVPSDANEPAGEEEVDAGDIGVEVVDEHDPDAEPAVAVVEPALLEEYDESVMVWGGGEQSEDEAEVCSSNLKRRRVCKLMLNRQCPS